MRRSIAMFQPGTKALSREDAMRLIAELQDVERRMRALREALRDADPRSASLTSPSHLRPHCGCPPMSHQQGGTAAFDKALADKLRQRYEHRPSLERAEHWLVTTNPSRQKQRRRGDEGTSGASGALGRLMGMDQGFFMSRRTITSLDPRVVVPSHQGEANGCSSSRVLSERTLPGLAQTLSWSRCRS